MDHNNSNDKYPFMGRFSALKLTILYLVATGGWGVVLWMLHRELFHIPKSL